MFRVGPWMGGWAWGWPMLVSSLVFWALVVAAIVLVIRYLTRRGQPWAGPRSFHPGPGPGPGPYPPPGGFPPPGAPGPEQILAERFARGEIDEQEFHQRLAALRT